MLPVRRIFNRHDFKIADRRPVIALTLLVPGIFADRYAIFFNKLIALIQRQRVAAFIKLYPVIAFIMYIIIYALIII